MPKHIDIAEIIKQDIRRQILRKRVKYGRRQEHFQWRRALWEAYEETLDQAIFLRQLIGSEN